MAKQLRFESEARESLKQGVVKLARAVKTTLGPRGRTAVIDRGWGGPTITKDGYTVADEVDLQDKYENLGAQMLKEAASKTHDVSGDGTTTATVLAEAIFLGALRHLGVGANTAAINRGILEATERVKKTLRDKAVKVSLDTPERLVQIASIAANNDKPLGTILIDALKKVGKDGVINIEEGKGTETSVKVVEGMQFDRGYLSPHFATDQRSLECEYRNCLVLIHEDKISSVKKLIPLLEKASKAKRPLLIIAEDVDGEALATLVVNKLRSVVDCVAVKAPGYGDRRKAMLQDIAILTGAKKPVFKETGVDPEQLELADLGVAKKVTITADNTTIVEGGGSASELSARVKQIRLEITETDSSYDREKLEERLAKLAGGVAQIDVGASTETELKERKARIKDALASVKAALEEGVLPGGGTALLRAGAMLDLTGLTGDALIGATILRDALKTPLQQIVENAGGHGPVIAARVLRERKFAHGYNAETDTCTDLIEDGVIDPCKVTTSALTNAASVATVLISAECLITDVPKKADEAGGAEDHEHMD
ncbi:MAG: chaperonin GroEL [Planctomycetes bacterium]|nr:chaperonin GroEL [Planctomycetota bacterium]